MHGSLPFSKAFDLASGAIGDRFTNPFWKIKEFLFGTQLRTAVREVKTFGRMIVSDSITKRESERPIDNKASDNIVGLLQINLINALLDNIDDHQVIADAAMNFLSAGKVSHPSYYLIFDTLPRTLTRKAKILNQFFLRKRHNRPILNLDFLPPLPSSIHCPKYPI